MLFVLIVSAFWNARKEEFLLVKKLLFRITSLYARAGVTQKLNLNRAEEEKIMSSSDDIRFQVITKKSWLKLPAVGQDSSCLCLDFSVLTQ